MEWLFPTICHVTLSSFDLAGEVTLQRLKGVQPDEVKDSKSKAELEALIARLKESEATICCLRADEKRNMPTGGHPPLPDLQTLPHTELERLSLGQLLSLPARTGKFGNQFFQGPVAVVLSAADEIKRTDSTGAVVHRFGDLLTEIKNCPRPPVGFHPARTDADDALLTRLHKAGCDYIDEWEGKESFTNKLAMWSRLAGAIVLPVSALGDERNVENRNGQSFIKAVDPIGVELPIVAVLEMRRAMYLAALRKVFTFVTSLVVALLCLILCLVAWREHLQRNRAALDLRFPPGSGILSEQVRVAVDGTDVGWTGKTLFREAGWVKLEVRDLEARFEPFSTNFVPLKSRETTQVDVAVAWKPAYAQLLLSSNSAPGNGKIEIVLTGGAGMTTNTLQLNPVPDASGGWITPVFLVPRGPSALQIRAQFRSPVTTTVDGRPGTTNLIRPELQLEPDVVEVHGLPSGTVVDDKAIPGSVARIRVLAGEPRLARIRAPGFREELLRFGRGGHIGRVAFNELRLTPETGFLQWSVILPAGFESLVASLPVTVRVDGQPFSTLQGVTGVAPGKHSIQFTHDLLVPTQMEGIEITDAATNQVELRPRFKPALVVVQRPTTEDWELRVNGQHQAALSADNTEAKFEVPPGKVELELTSARFQPLRTNSIVPPGSTWTWNPDGPALKPGQVRFRFITEGGRLTRPPGLELIVDGKSQMVDGDSLSKELASGSHSFSVGHPEFETAGGTLSVAAGQGLEQEVHLRRKRVPLVIQVSSVLTNPNLEIDGVAVPWSPAKAIQVPAGVRVLRLSGNGFATVEVTMDVQPTPNAPAQAKEWTPVVDYLGNLALSGFPRGTVSSIDPAATIRAAADAPLGLTLTLPDFKPAELGWQATQPAYRIRLGCRLETNLGLTHLVLSDGGSSGARLLPQFAKVRLHPTRRAALQAFTRYVGELEDMARKYRGTRIRYTPRQLEAEQATLRNLHGNIDPADAAECAPLMTRATNALSKLSKSYPPVDVVPPPN